MSVNAKELATGLDLATRQSQRRPRPVACCPRCSAITPLISTMAFTGAEFYCLECGGHFGFLSPRAVEDTPALSAQLKTLEAEWRELRDGLQVEGRVADPERHEAALVRLAARAKR